MPRNHERCVGASLKLQALMGRIASHLQRLWTQLTMVIVGDLLPLPPGTENHRFRAQRL